MASVALPAPTLSCSPFRFQLRYHLPLDNYGPILGTPPAPRALLAPASDLVPSHPAGAPATPALSLCRQLPKS